MHLGNRVHVEQCCSFTGECEMKFQFTIKDVVVEDKKIGELSLDVEYTVEELKEIYAQLPNILDKLTPILKSLS